MSRKDLTRYNLLAVGAIAAPMLLVGLGSNVIGAGPGLSLALGHKPGGEAGGTESPATMNAVNSPKRKTAMERVAALRGGAVAATPFRPEPVAVKPVVEAAPEPAAGPAPLARPDVVVKMIMRGGGVGGSAARALIGGKICVEGDSVGDGWTIRSIDAEERSVTFASADGQSYTVSLK